MQGKTETEIDRALNALKKPQRVVAEKICFSATLAAWIWAAIWAAHAARAF